MVKGDERMSDEWRILTPDDYWTKPPSAHGSERTVELALAQRWMGKHDCIVKVGAVTPYHTATSHDIVDPFDEKATIKTPMELVDFTGENVLSISTIEHIGLPEYGNEDLNTEGGVIALKKILDESESCFVTIPMGYNECLDNWVGENLDSLDCFAYLKTSSNPVLWDYIENPTSVNYSYNQPYSFANFVLFVEGWKS